MPSKRAPELSKRSVAPRRAKSNRRTAQASTHEDADNSLAESPQVYIKTEAIPQKMAQDTTAVATNGHDSASSSSSNSSIPRIFINLTRKAKPQNLKEQSTDEDSDRPPKRTSKTNRHDEGPARKKAREQVAPATTEMVQGCFAMIAKSYEMRDEQLRAAQDKVEELKMKLVEAQNHLASRTKVNGRKIQSDTKPPENAKTEMEVLRDALKETKLQLSNANHKLSIAQLTQAPGRSTHLENDLESQVESLQVKLEKSRDEVLKMREWTAELQADLTERIQKENKDPDYSKVKVSDDYIELLWGQVAFGIQQLPNRFLKNDPNGRELPVTPHRPNGVEKLLGAVTKSPCWVVTSYYLQGYVWLYIHFAVFMGCHDTWGQNVGTSFLHFTHTLHGIFYPFFAQKPLFANLFSDNEFDVEDAEAFSFVKGRASSLLDNIFQKYEEPAVDGIIDKLVADLAIFLVPGYESEFREELREILTRACELQRIFLMSRAFFIPRMIPRNSELDEKTMNIRYYHNVDMNGKLDLDIAVSPYLEKIGTADGWKFEQRRVLCKAIVTVKAPPEDSKSSTEDVKLSSEDLKSSSEDLKSSSEDLKSSSEDFKSSSEDSS